MSVSGDSLGDGREDTNLTPLQRLEESMENLTEKRGSTRESALDIITKELRANFQWNFLEANKLTLVEAVKRGIKKGSAKEIKSSCEVLSLIAVTVGPDSESIYKDVSPALEELVNNPDVQEGVRASLITCLAALCFISVNDEVLTLNVMQTLKKVWNETHRNKEFVITAALEGWGLLLTTVNRRHVYDYIIPEDLSLIVEHLSSEFVDVRVAAGHCIALLFEVGREIEEDTFDVYKFSHYASVDVDNLLDTLYELSADKTKQRAKKDKLKQKTPFKEITTFVEEGTTPIETLSFKHQSFTFDSWSMIVQLDFLRDILGEGLKVHFEENELLTDIFGMVLNRDAKKTQLSAVEKRMFMSPNSPLAKARSKNLNKQRTQKGALQGDSD